MGKMRFDVRSVHYGEDGKIISATPWKPSRSFVIQFLEILYSTGNIEHFDITMITGAEDEWFYTTNPRADADSGDINMGIVVGTGTNSPSNTDYKLQTRINHGGGSGQLSYGSMGHILPNVIGVNVDYIMTRTFTNSSGATVTIQEVGIYCDEGVTDKYRCICRDIHVCAIPNNESRTIEYRWRTTA